MEPTMTDEELIHELNELIQLDYDASRTYEHALQHVADEQARADLQAFMRDHLQHITDLRSVIVELGGAPIEPSRDLKGALLEGMTKLRSATGTMGALTAMRMNEKLTNRTYDRASELDLPPRIRQVIAANLGDERRHLAAIKGHIARLRSEGDADDDDNEEPVDRSSREVEPTIHV
jgi:uncharacterized protein (TIGR02284 family)